MPGKIRKIALLLLLASFLPACGPKLKPLPEIDEVIEKAATGDEESLALLVRYFSSPVEDEPLKALGALVEAEVKAVPYLISALEDDDPIIAESAAGALGNIRDTRAVGPLLKAVDRPDFPKYAAVWALGEIGSNEAIGPLIEYLGNENPEVRKYATRALIKFGDKALPAAIEALNGSNQWTRHYAARVLGQSGDRRAVAPLMAHYRTLEPDVALWALGKLGDRQAFTLITGELENSDWKIRLAAVQSLGELEDERGLSLLKEALEDPEWIIREWAARGLEHITKERQLYRDQYGKLVAPYNLYR